MHSLVEANGCRMGFGTLHNAYVGVSNQDSRIFDLIIYETLDHINRTSTALLSHEYSHIYSVICQAVPFRTHTVVRLQQRHSPLHLRSDCAQGMSPPAQLSGLRHLKNRMLLSLW